MASHMRCPACHLRLRATMKLLVEQAKLEWRQEQKKSRNKVVDDPVPEDDARSFPCHRCGTPIEHGKMVRGAYDERVPAPVVLEAPLAGVAVGFLFGSLYGWGMVAGIVTGLVGAAISMTMLVPLHHNVSENRMLKRLGLPPAWGDWSEAIAFIAIVLVMPGIATLLYNMMGWTGLIGTTVVGIALLVYISFKGDYHGDFEGPAIVEQNPQQVDDAADLKLKQ